MCGGAVRVAPAASARASKSSTSACETAGTPRLNSVELSGPTGKAASFLMYESASGERFTVYTAKASVETAHMRYTTLDDDGAMFWADRGVGYVVSGSGDRERLTEVARAVYDQVEKSGS